MILFTLPELLYVSFSSFFNRSVCSNCRAYCSAAASDASVQLAENLFNDLKETKKDDNKITEQINSLGKKVLNENIKEIENILDV